MSYEGKKKELDELWETPASSTSSSGSRLSGHGSLATRLPRGSRLEQTFFTSHALLHRKVRAMKRAVLTVKGRVAARWLPGRWLGL
jgi:hypothetical protein